MKYRLTRAAAIFILAVALFNDPATASPAVSAKSALVMDAATGRILWSFQPDDRALIASTTKIMTGLLVAEECDLSARVLIGKESVGVEGSSVYLQEGEILSVEALLYGMMLHSGNDAATALASYCGGSVENFVEKMNQKADELGLDNTKFANPHGLDSDENYSTAKDLALLTAYAMENPVFCKVVSCKTAEFGNRCFTNHNKLLWQYPGAIGVKTGYTKSAGRILVSCAERGGRRLIAVTMSDPNDWRDHCDMLDFGFEEYTSTRIATADELKISVPVIGGSEAECIAVLKEDIIYPVSKDENITFQYHLPKFIYPPVLTGDRAGVLCVFLDGVEIAEYPLYWQYSVLEGA